MILLFVTVLNIFTLLNDIYNVRLINSRNGSTLMALNFQKLRQSVYISVDPFLEFIKRTL